MTSFLRKIAEKIDCLVLKILMDYGFFNGWYKRHISTVLFDIELLEGMPEEIERIKKKYLDKLNKTK